MPALITNEKSGYYGEYAADPAKLARVFADGFAFQGEMMASRRRPRGGPSAGLSATAFVAFLENHDQIGNRAIGERTHALASPTGARAAAAIYLLCQQVPMIFMGEEWAASTPFLFSCDVEKNPTIAVRDGRRAEFVMFSDLKRLQDIPDPTVNCTLPSSKLDWGEVTKSDHAKWLEFYASLIKRGVRRSFPDCGLEGYAGHAEMFGDRQLHARWRLPDRSQLHLTTNLSCVARPAPALPRGTVLWKEGETTTKRLARGA